MQEIAPHIFIETAYPGVTLGAINWPHTLILIDAPLRPDDIRLWRTTLANMTNSANRLLVNLDEHYDRTIGARQVECMVAGHEKMNGLLKDRPLAFKTQTVETGSEWELQNGLGTIRWAQPDISFSHRTEIHWETDPLVLEYHPGPSICNCWVELPNQKVIFIGDTVVPNAPPFLAASDLPEWKQTLSLLLTPKYKDYQFISSRGGLIDPGEIKEQLRFLEKVEHQLVKLVEKKSSLLEIERAAHTLIKNFDLEGDMAAHGILRLSWGLQQYLKHHPTLESGN